MSNEPEIGKEMLKEGQLMGTSDTAQNKVQVEQIAKDSSGTVLGLPSSYGGNSTEVLENTHNSNTGKNTEPSKDLSEKYRLIASNTSDLIAFTTFDVDPVFTFVNPSYLKILEFEAEELLGKSWFAFIHQDDTQQMRAILIKYFDAKINGILTFEMVEEAQKLDFRIRDKSGQWHLLQGTINIVNDELLFVSKEITQQKQAGATLYQSEEMLSKAFRLSPEMITITSLKEGRFVDVNESFLRTNGYSRDEVIGRNATELNIWVDPNDRVRFVQALKEHRSIRNLEFNMRTKSGEIGTVLMSSEIITINGEPYALTVTTDITNRKHLEEKMWENEQKMKSIIQGLSIAAFFIDSDHRVLYWNKMLEELCNIRAEDIIGTTNHWKAFYSQERPCMVDILIDGGLEDIEKWYAGRYKKSSLLNESFEATDFFPNLGSDGKWLRFTATVIRNTNGDMVGALETLEDISERKIAEIALQKSEKKYRLVVENAMESIVVVQDGIFKFVNHSSLNLLGYSQEEIVNKAFIEFIHPDDRKMVLDNHSRRLKGENTPSIYSFRIITKQGVVRWVEIQAIVISWNEQPATLNFLRDVTEQIKAQKALTISEGKYKNLYNSLIDGFAAVDLQGKIIECNTAFENIVGYSIDELRSITFEEITPMKWHNIERKILEEQVVRRGYSDVYEKEYKRKDGEIHPVELQTYAIRNNENQLCGFWAFVRDITKRKQTEGALRESEERFRLVISSITDILYEWDIKTGSMQWFGDIDSRLGYENGTFQRTIKDFLKHVHPEDVNNVQAVATNGLKSHQKWQGEYRVINKNGAERYWYGTGIGIYDHEGNAIKVVGALTDITERKRAEEELRRSEEQYRLVTDNASDIIWTMDLNLRFTYFSPSNEKLTGYTTEKALTLSLDEYLTAESVERALQVYAAEMEIETTPEKDISRFVTLELNQKRADGTIFPIEVRMCFLRDAHQNPIGILGIARDITERKKMEESFRENEEKYRKIVENTQDLIMLTSPDGRVSYLSPSCVNILGYSPDDLVGKIPEIFHPEDIEKVHTALSSAIQGNKGSNLEYRIHTKDGKTKWISHSWSPLLTENHELKCIVSVVRDVTESKIAEQSLKQKIEELEKYKSITVNREVKMVDLKNEINELCKQLNQKPKYPNV